MFRILCLGLSMVIVAGLTSPANAQRKTHGAGVSWSGGHGGVSWDGGHAYEGGTYSGYPAAPSPYPAYKPLPPAYKTPLSSSPVDLIGAEHSQRGDHRDRNRVGKTDRR